MNQMITMESIEFSFFDKYFTFDSNYFDIFYKFYISANLLILL